MFIFMFIIYNFSSTYLIFTLYLRKYLQFMFSLSLGLSSSFFVVCYLLRNIGYLFILLCQAFFQHSFIMFYFFVYCWFTTNFEFIRILYRIPSQESFILFFRLVLHLLHMAIFLPMLVFSPKAFALQFSSLPFLVQCWYVKLHQYIILI